jgi:hypothetical protein
MKVGCSAHGEDHVRCNVTYSRGRSGVGESKVQSMDK